MIKLRFLKMKCDFFCYENITFHQKKMAELIYKTLKIDDELPEKIAVKQNFVYDYNLFGIIFILIIIMLFIIIYSQIKYTKINDVIGHGI